MGDFVQLPTPKYALGTRLDLSRLEPSDRAYYGKKILSEIFRDMRAVLQSLKKEGYLKDMKGKKIPPHNKAQIREMLNVLLNPDSVELAGMKPEGMHVTGTVSNQCYLRNGQCHGGVSFCYYLLFRKEVDGSKLVYVHTDPVIREEYLKNLVIAQAAPAP
jgi:hypothetical protein